MEIRFINRVREFEVLRNFCSRYRYIPLYIFGPEGCGKTRLLKEFVKRFNRLLDRDSIAIYIDALERDSIDKALLTSQPVKLAENILTSIIEKFTGFSIGRILAEHISTILEKIIGWKLKDKYILVVIDDVVKAIGPNEIERYVRWLQGLMEKLYDEYKPKTINFIATTSEGASLNLVSRHRHASPTLLWNLDKNSFEEMFHELNPPNSIKFEDIWILLGGNPGKLVELAEKYEWNTENMKKAYTSRVKNVVEEIISKDLDNLLEEAVKDVTVFDKTFNREINKLKEILVETNLLILKDWTTLTGSEIPVQREIGIGGRYAWQIPMYRDLIINALKELKI
ncbi:MAG: ATP-binding protein [Candidatus Methanomethylicia archaeon]